MTLLLFVNLISTAYPFLCLCFLLIFSLPWSP